MNLRDCDYKGRIIGKISPPAIQPDGIYINIIPKRYVDPEVLGLLILCLLDGYTYKIGASGELWLKLPRNTKYGPIINSIARAYYELQTGKKDYAEGQQQLTKEVL